MGFSRRPTFRPRRPRVHRVPSAFFSPLLPPRRQHHPLDQPRPGNPRPPRRQRRPLRPRRRPLRRLPPRRPRPLRAPAPLRIRRRTARRLKVAWRPVRRFPFPPAPWDAPASRVSAGTGVSRAASAVGRNVLQPHHGGQHPHARGQRPPVALLRPLGRAGIPVRGARGGQPGETLGRARPGALAAVHPGTARSPSPGARQAQPVVRAFAPLPPGEPRRQVRVAAPADAGQRRGRRPRAAARRQARHGGLPQSIRPAGRLRALVPGASSRHRRLGVRRRRDPRVRDGGRGGGWNMVHLRSWWVSCQLSPLTSDRPPVPGKPSAGRHRCPQPAARPSARAPAKPHGVPTGNNGLLGRYHDPGAYGRSPIRVRIRAWPRKTLPLPLRAWAAKRPKPSRGGGEVYAPVQAYPDAHGAKPPAPRFAHPIALWRRRCGLCHPGAFW